jgi:hypothetical protein
MRKFIAAGLLALLSATASAQAPTIRFYADLGYAQGGDPLVSAYWVNGSGQVTGGVSLNAGDGYVMALGGDMRFADRWALQASLGYESKRVTAANANLIFDRYPVELLAFYDLTPRWRLGAGVRKAMYPFVTGTDAAQGWNGTGAYDSTPGPVVEAQYLFNEAPLKTRGIVSGVHLRWIQESFSQTDSNGVLQTRKGDHAAIGIFFYY